MSGTLAQPVDPDFLAADDMLEELYSILRNPQPESSVSEQYASLEEFYRRGSEEIRYKVLTELIEMEYSGARSLLLYALQQDESALVRHEAAFGLGILKHLSNIDPLIQAMLRDKNLMVRHEAAAALSEVGDARALEALAKATCDEHREVASSARYAMQNIQLRLYRESE